MTVEEANTQRNFIGKFGSIWGLGGVILLIGSAVGRLTPIALETFDHTLTRGQWITLMGFTLFMTAGEGYKGFQQGFAPRVAARARHLRDHPRLLHSIFAPFFCMAYFHTTRRRQLTSISITLGIIGLIVAVSFTEQPWHGIIDFGVVLGLIWGLIALFVFGYKSLGTDSFTHSPELPG